LTTPTAKKGGYESGTRVQEFKTSFTALAGEKETFFDAAILIFSPLAGLRLSRSGKALTLNFPNPAKETSSSLAAALTMLFQHAIQNRLRLRFGYVFSFCHDCDEFGRVHFKVPGESGKGGCIAQGSLEVMSARDDVSHAKPSTQFDVFVPAPRYGETDCAKLSSHLV
jgi:hypothetical protein